MLQLEEKIQVMDQGVQNFFNKIDALQKKGLPGLKVINDKLMTLPDYKKRLTEVSKDNSKFAGIQGSITGKAFMDALIWILVSNMRLNTYSLSSLHLLNIQTWMKYIGDYLKSQCQVISDGKNCVIY
jgi:hypothetical protein